jgi:hypothetical protein
MQPVAEPVVERPLAVPANLDSLLRLGLLDQRLGLTALDPACKELLAQRGHIHFCIRNSRSQRSSAAGGGATFLQASQPVWQLSAAGADYDQAPP